MRYFLRTVFSVAESSTDDILFHHVAAFHRLKIGSVLLYDIYCIYILGIAYRIILEDKYGGIAGIAQRQHYCMYIFLIVENNGVCSHCSDCQRVERVIEYGLIIIRIVGFERAIHHGTSCHRTIIFVRT